MYLVRLEHAQEHVIRFTLVSLAASVPLAGFALALIAAASGLTAGTVWIVAGGCANVVATIASTCLARGGSFVLSAAVDSLSGPGLALAGVVLAATDQPVTVWGTTYGAVWIAVGFVGSATAASVARRSGDPHKLPPLRLAGAWPMVVSGLLSQAYNRVDYLLLTVVATDYRRGSGQCSAR